DRLQALAFASRTASAAGVERETARAVAAHARFVRLGVEPPDRVPEADVGGWTRARRLADRRLIDFEHAIDRLPAANLLAAVELRVPALAPRARELDEIGIEHVARESALAAAGDAGDHVEPAQRNPDLEPFQIVQIGARDDERGLALARHAPRDQRMSERRREEASGHRFRRAHQLLRRSLGDDTP